jgi:phosphogluconate dehydratase
VTPEAADGGAIAKICNGDMIRLDAVEGRLEVLVDAAEWASRGNATADLSGNDFGVGRELFMPFRAQVNRADEGATIFRVQ